MIRLKTIFKNHYFILAAVILLFLVFRLPGVDLSYYQDEWKTVRQAAIGGETAGSFFAHPPLASFLFQVGLFVFGADNFRLFFILISLMSVYFLYKVIKFRSDRQTALIALFLYALSFYNVWASLMVDLDGAILPLLFLVSIYTYDRWSLNNSSDNFSIFWGVLTALVIFLGLMIKLSFILVFGVLALDILITSRRRLTDKTLAVYIFSGGLFLLAVAATFIIAGSIYPAFRLDRMVNHILYFINFTDRSYLQVIVQSIKSIFYLSPLLVFSIFLGYHYKIWPAMRLFLYYIALGLIFYFIIFDFSGGAIDKYLAFLIIPLIAITSYIIRQIFRDQTGSLNIIASLGGGLLTGLLLLIVLWRPHFPLSLYPKGDWFKNILIGDWNILLPFTGGSGPIGFYISFLFIVSAFIAAAIMTAGILIFPRQKKNLCIILLTIIITYNLVFTEELFFGRLNGSITAVLNSSLAYIAEAKAVDKIITHNDIGAYELFKMDKYQGRFYAAPQFAENHKKIFSRYDGYFLVVDMPKINPDGFYGRYFSFCDSVFSDTSKNIKADIYYCDQAAKDYLID